MRIGFISPYDRERIDFMRRNGFGCVELVARPDDPFLPGKDGWKDKAAEVKNAYHEAGIRISCIAGFYVNHMDSDPNVARQHYDHVRNVITFAKEIGVGVVGGFSGRVMNEPLENSIAPFKRIWNEHAQFAEDHGVRIAFEHCPMGTYHSVFGPKANNAMSTPWMWERCFNEVPSKMLGLEWDPSHLVGMLIDPVQNIHEWGHKIFHVHAKDAHVYRDLIDRYGIYHEGAIEHCFPGLGDSNWGLIIKELRRAGYHGDLNIEGVHDKVFRDHPNGPRLEDLGLLIARRHLEQFIDNV